MNPIYKFELDRNGADRRQVYPNYKTDLAMEFAKESQQQFFRRKLSGKLTFLSEDYVFISQTLFDTKFGLYLSISYDLGQTWLPYWQGMFWKTDCEINEDDQTVTVAPSVDDLYGKVLDGIEKEYDLIKLAPEINFVKADKRPMVQIYCLGNRVLGCYLSGMWWEQEVTDSSIIADRLMDTYHFAYLLDEWVANIGGNASPQLPDSFYGEAWGSGSVVLPVTYSCDGFDMTVSYSHPNFTVVISHNNVDMWTGTFEDFRQTRTLTPIPGSGASGNVTIDANPIMVFARLICDVDSIGGVATYDIPANDIVANNRNYRKCVPYRLQNKDIVIFTNRKSLVPTEYGLYSQDLYYDAPQVPLYYGELYPCARASWLRVSVWFKPDYFESIIEQNARKPITLRDCFTLFGSIKVLLHEIAPEVDWDETSAYSEFLFGSPNPISGINQKLFLTPKSNVINSNYDQPAQKAPVTLKTITDMLRDCFRCYWFIEDGKFRIEHISYFQRGGSYTGSPIVGRDLTQEQVTRNGKPWSFGKNAYSFDKPDTFGRYQFEWMDDCTQQFEGFPINILSGYVNKAMIEQVSVSQFTSDIDFILLNPSTISQDGFVLLSAINDGGNWVLPYVNFLYNITDHILQNAYVSFMFLQNYYVFDMPAPDYEVNGEQKRAIDTRRLRLQEIQFPCLLDPEETKLIKTGLGFGILEKISVNLSSRNGKATLKFPTQ